MPSSKLSKQGEVSYVRYRPLGRPHDDGSPRWDLYDACEEIARRSWQGAATDGTTLSHEAVRGFLREAHEAAAAAGAVDLNLLLIDGVPAAFIYGYHYRGYVYGLRRGYDAERSREGRATCCWPTRCATASPAATAIYDMGVGSLESKRHFQTRLLPILRFSHFPLLAVRTQLLRVKRWWQGRRSRRPSRSAVFRMARPTRDELVSAGGTLLCTLRCSTHRHRVGRDHRHRVARRRRMEHARRRRTDAHGAARIAHHARLD